MAASEIMGSRRAWEDGKNKYGEALFVSTSYAEAPSVGDGFTPAPTGSDIETGYLGRKCVKVTINPEVVPGVYLFKCTYMAFKAYA